MFSLLRQDGASVIRVSDSFIVRPVKVAKTYPHVRQLQDNILQRRVSTVVTEALSEGSAGGHPFSLVHRAPGPGESKSELESARVQKSRLGSIQ